MALVSITAISVILLAVLALVVVNALAESPWGVFTIAATMPIALAMGLALRAGGHERRARLGHRRRDRRPRWPPSGAASSSAARRSRALLTLRGTTLAWWIMGYGLVASIVPVWLLLAPRDYLSTFMKIGTIAALGVAIVILGPAPADAGR